MHLAARARPRPAHRLATALLRLGLVLVLEACGGNLTVGPTSDASFDGSPATPGSVNSGPDAGDACSSTLDLSAAHYDQSCSADSDCIAIGEGNVCDSPCAIVCGVGGAIRASAYPQYLADRAATGIDDSGVGCGCPVQFPPVLPCCVAGACHRDSACVAPEDGGPAAADAGAAQSDDDAGASALPACTWPADLDDGGIGWTVGRTWLQCDAGSGTTAGCLSDNLTTCPGADPVVGGSYSQCVDRCASDHYAVAAGGPPIQLADGGIGQRPTPNLPAACVAGAFTPGGTTFYCCPCE